MMTENTYIISDELIMRPLQEKDAEEIFAVIDSNRTILRNWLGWVNNVKSVEDSKKFVIQSIEGFSKNKVFRFGIFSQQRYAGMIDLDDVSLEHKRAIVGYWLGKEFQRRGIMTEALKKLLEFGFEKLDLNRIEIHIAPNNIKSRAIPEKLGFVQEGRLRQFEWLFDHFEDHLVFSMLKSEWQK
ncbi:GNAT family N-acetyltransferase [Candidatus Dojkabacteria bacterium]|nr:GNAT family N-acetyltransferase [Candidatus Dojkabacteria bacterium]